ncbi:MAG: hypothetical protein KF869_06475 [Phycisphaeraceae bacterium]|nr:hypothetical protein [Phycisphaeraceae bacterium]
MLSRKELRRLSTLVWKIGLSADKFATAWRNPQSIATRETFRMWGDRMLKNLAEADSVLDVPQVRSRDWSEELFVAFKEIRWVLPWLIGAATDSGREPYASLRVLEDKGEVLQRLYERVAQVPDPAGTSICWVRTADAAKVIPMRSCSLLRKLQRAGIPLVGSAKRRSVDLAALLELFPSKRRRLESWAERYDPAPL